MRARRSLLPLGLSHDHRARGRCWHRARVLTGLRPLASLRWLAPHSLALGDGRPQLAVAWSRYCVRVALTLTGRWALPWLRLHRLVDVPLTPSLFLPTAPVYVLEPYRHVAMVARPQKRWDASLPCLARWTPWRARLGFSHSELRASRQVSYLSIAWTCSCHSQ